MNQALQAIFGDVIRSCRKEQNISQEQLALKSNLQRSFISRMERGKAQPTLVTIFELSMALNKPPVDVIAAVQKRWERG